MQKKHTAIKEVAKHGEEMAKKLLKFGITFTAGLVVGGAIAYTFVGWAYQKQFQRWALLQAESDFLMLETYRSEDGPEWVDRYFESVEQSIPSTITIVHENGDSEPGARGLLITAKRYFVCTGRPVPEEIRQILDSVEMDPETACTGPEPKPNENLKTLTRNHKRTTVMPNGFQISRLQVHTVSPANGPRTRTVVPKNDEQLPADLRTAGAE